LKKAGQSMILPPKTLASQDQARQAERHPSPTPSEPLPKNKALKATNENIEPVLGTFLSLATVNV
jgi:hypothetical protein